MSLWVLWLGRCLFLHGEYRNIRNYEYLNVKDPPSPEDLLNTDRCMKKWGSILGDCIVDCNAVPDCEAKCIDDYKDNIEYCPCEVMSVSILNL